MGFEKHQGLCGCKVLLDTRDHLCQSSYLTSLALPHGTSSACRGDEMVGSKLFCKDISLVQENDKRDLLGALFLHEH